MNPLDYSRYLRQCQPFRGDNTAKTCKFSPDRAAKVDRDYNLTYNKRTGAKNVQPPLPEKTLPDSAPSYKRPAFAPRTVIAYHGCSEEIAERILAEGKFFPSTNTYDWLGAGIYFWEYAPNRALRWAEEQKKRRGGSPAVVGATIRLGRCLNLLDSAKAPILARSYNDIISNLGTRRLPRNTNTGAHFLDREVIDTHCSIAKEKSSYLYQTVRGSYPEGEPIYPGSKILSLTHTQIAVRDAVCISQIHRLDLSQILDIRR